MGANFLSEPFLDGGFKFMESKLFGEAEEEDLLVNGRVRENLRVAFSTNRASAGSAASLGSMFSNVSRRATCWDGLSRIPARASVT